MLLARIYEVFPLLCTRCGEPVRIIAFITDVGSVQWILEHIGEPTQPPRIAPAARGPPDWEGDFDTRERDTFAWSEPLPEYEFDQRVSW
jgi:hypothetical protein